MPPNASINQIMAASYEKVVNEKNKPANQWEESAFMRELERLGAIVRKSLGPTIEMTLDYRRNPGTDFLALDTTSTSMEKTEYLTAASYTPAEISVPGIWTKRDEGLNPSENQKIAFVAGLFDNMFSSHDDAIEEALFASNTDGFIGLAGLFDATNGQGSVGGIDAGTEVFWRNKFGTYVDSGANIDAALETAWNAASKGSGAGLSVKSIVSGAEAQSLWMSGQTDKQRWVNAKEVDASFVVAAFKSARWIFSQYGGTKIYGFNPRCVKLVVSKEMYRDLGDKYEIPNMNAYGRKLYSLLQLGTNNRSRAFVLDEVST